MEEVSWGSARVVDLFSREEVVRWTRGEIEAWTSKNPSRILYWFGPKGQKQLGDWSQDEKESLLAQINGREVSSPDEWGLISIGVLGQRRTGQQCETQAELFWRGGSYTKGATKLELSWVSERNDEALSLVSQKKVEQTLPVFEESNVARMCCELEDGRVILSPSRLLLDSSRSVRSARMQPTVQLDDDEHDESEKDERINRSKKRRMKTRRKPTDRSLKPFSSSKASSTAQPPETNDDEDVLTMVLPWRRTSNTSVSGGEAAPQSIGREESNHTGVGLTPEIESESPRAEGEEESSVWDVPRIHSQGSLLNKSIIDEEEEVVNDEGDQVGGDISEEVQSDPTGSPIMKRVRRAITLSPSTASAGSTGEKNTNPPIEASDDDDDDEMQVTFTSAGMNPRDLYRRVRNELIQKHLDHALVLLRKEKSARLESEYQTMAQAANSLLSTLRKEYGVVDDDRDDEFFDWEGADEEMPPRMSPATYTRLRSYNKEESHRRLKKVLKESASIWKELKEMKIIAVHEATSSNEDDDDQWWDSETPAQDDEHLFTDSEEEEDDENANLSQRVSVKKARNVVHLDEAIEVRGAKRRNSGKGIMRRRKKVRRDDSREVQTESRDKGPSSRQTHMDRFAHLVVSDDDDEAISEAETSGKRRISHAVESNSNRHVRLFATASYPSERAVSGTDTAPISTRETATTSMPPPSGAATGTRSALFRTRPRALRNADDTYGVLIGEEFILPSTRNAASLGPFPSSRRSVVASSAFSSLENKQGHGESLADLVDYIDAQEGPMHDNDMGAFYIEDIDGPSSESIVVPARPARSDQFLGERFLDGDETIEQQSSSSSSSSRPDLCYRPQRRGVDALSLVSDFFVNPSWKTFGDLDDAFAFDGMMSAAVKNHPLAPPDKLKTLFDLAAIPLLELCFSKAKRTEYVSSSRLDSYFNIESNVLNIETSVLNWSIVLGDKPLAMFLCILLMHQFLCLRIRTGDRWLSRSDTGHEQSLWATMRKAAIVFRFSVWSPFNAVVSAWLEDPLRFGKGAPSISIIECLQQLSGRDSNHNHSRGEWSFKRFAKELCQTKLSSSVSGGASSSTSPIRSRLEWCEFVWGALFTMLPRLMMNKQRREGSEDNNWQWVLECLLPNQAFWKQEPLKQMVESAVTQLSGGLSPRQYVRLMLRRCCRLLELWGSPSSTKSLSGVALTGLLNTSAGVLFVGGMGIGDDDEAFVEFRSLFVKEMMLCSSVGSRLRLGTDVVTRCSSFKVSTTIKTGWVMGTIAEQCCVLSLVLTTMKDQTSKILKKILSFVSQLSSGVVVAVDQQQQNNKSSNEDDVSCLQALVRATKALEDAFVIAQQQQPEIPLSTWQVSGNLSKATSGTIQTWWSAAALGNAAPGDVFMLLLKEGHMYFSRQQGRSGESKQKEMYPDALEKMIESLSRLVVLRDNKSLSAIPLVPALGSLFIQNEIWMQAPRVTLAAVDVIHRIVYPILHPDTDGDQGLDEDTLIALAMDRTEAQTQVVKSLAPFFRSMFPLVVTDLLFFIKEQDVNGAWRIIELAADLAALSVTSAEVQQDLVFKFGHADRWRTVSNPAACRFSQCRDFFLVPLRFLLCLTKRNEASLVDLLDLKSIFAVFWRSLIVLGPHPTTTSLLLPPLLAEFSDRVLMPKIRRERAAQQGSSSGTIQRSDSFSASIGSSSSSLFSIESILREFIGLQPSCIDPVEALVLSVVVANGEEEHAINEWKMSVERLMISIPHLATSVELLDRLVTVVVRTRNLFLLATHLFLLIVCDERLGYDRFPPMAQRARKLFQLVPQYLHVQHLYIQAGVVSNAPVDLVRLRTFIVGDSSPSSPLRTLSSSEQRVILEWIGETTQSDRYSNGGGSFKG